jgi:hypothetical protein
MPGQHTLSEEIQQILKIAVDQHGKKFKKIQLDYPELAHFDKKVLQAKVREWAALDKLREKSEAEFIIQHKSTVYFVGSNICFRRYEGH